MAAMPFPCNGILVVLGNLPRIFPLSYYTNIEGAFNVKIFY